MRENQQRKDDTLRHMINGLNIGLPNFLQQQDVAGSSSLCALGGYGYG